MGHRLFGHEGKCSHLHGHNYVGLFTARAKALDSVGRVIDFSVLKDKIGGWIEENWDHGFVYNAEDQFTATILAHAHTGYPLGQKRYALYANPTAEELAHYLLRTVCSNVLVDTGVQVVRVELWETENCNAVAEVDW
jgi:6-pyruvoyltetrahydropterin/6-carboxytetrahydropterin synthase